MDVLDQLLHQIVPISGSPCDGQEVLEKEEEKREGEVAAVLVRPAQEQKQLHQYRLHGRRRVLLQQLQLCPGRRVHLGRAVGFEGGQKDLRRDVQRVVVRLLQRLLHAAQRERAHHGLFGRVVAVVKEVNGFFDARKRNAGVVGVRDEVEQAVLQVGLEEIDVKRLGDGESGLQAGVEREIGGVCVGGENGENRVCELDARGKEGRRMEGGGFGVEEAIMGEGQKV